MVQLLASMEELVIFLLSSLDHYYFNLFSSVYWCSLVYHTWFFLGMTSSSFAWCSDTKQIFELDILGLENWDVACVHSLGRVLIMSFSIKDSVVSFIGKDIINTILIIWICINTVFFPIYCVILIILQKEYLDLMTEVEGLHTQLNDALNRNHETFTNLVLSS